MKHTAYNKGKGGTIRWLREHVGYRDEKCLTWPFSRLPNGYGRLGYLGAPYYAHRLMCELAHGPQPFDKPECRHSCGKGHFGCVNPNHLSWASQSDNHKDRRRHGTAKTNKFGNRTKLTDEQVAQIRSLKGKQMQAKTAKQFGISEPNVRRWQSTTHEPARPGTSESSLLRHRRKLLANKD